MLAFNSAGLARITRKHLHSELDNKWKRNIHMSTRAVKEACLFGQLVHRKITISDSKAPCNVCSGLIIVVIHTISIKTLNERVQLRLPTPPASVEIEKNVTLAPFATRFESSRQK